jgi:hypothetical protein
LVRRSWVADDLYARVLLHVADEAGGPLVAGRLAKRARQDGNLALGRTVALVEERNGHLGGDHARAVFIELHAGGRLRRDAIHIEDLDALGFGVLYGRHHRRGVYGVEHDQCRVLVDELAHNAGLVTGVAVAANGFKRAPEPLAGDLTGGVLS